MSPDKLIRSWSVQKAGNYLLILALACGVLGYINQHGWQIDLAQIVNDFYTNISTELASIAITILVIDALAQQRADEQRKTQLIRELRNPDNGIALRALRELEARNWTSDGSLKKAYLLGANLENGFLRDTDLSQAWLLNVNLQGAYMRNSKLTDTTLVGANLRGVRELTSSQLREARMLLGATMPNGDRYNGSFNLPEDIKAGQERGFNMNHPASAATFYGISKKAYLQGQEKGDEEIFETDKSIYRPEDWLSEYVGRKIVS
jgi:hypothetical protein